MLSSSIFGNTLQKTYQHSIGMLFVEITMCLNTIDTEKSAQLIEIRMPVKVLKINFLKVMDIKTLF
jgi:hypothetical protein